jgi:hypothetical protein
MYYVVVALSLQKIGKSAESTEMACRAARNLSCVDHIAIKLVQEYCCESIIEIISAFSDSISVLEVP